MSFLLYRPHSLAWEVRKQMSPGKCTSPTISSRRSPSPAAVRFLNFGPPKPCSWADRVRGVDMNADKDNDTKEVSVQTKFKQRRKNVVYHHLY